MTRTDWQRAARSALTAIVACTLIVSPVRAQPLVVDFDAAMRGLGFPPNTTDGNKAAGNAPNGMLDADEMALIAAILADPALDLSKRGGVSHHQVRAAFAQTRIAARRDLGDLVSTYPTSVDVTTGYVMLGKASFAAYADMLTTFGVTLKQDYTMALALDRYLAATGDADGDGVSNADEYAAHIAEGRNAYIRAALDPAVRTAPTRATVDAKALAAGTPAATAKKTLGIVLYTGFEVLDVFGPLEMWSYVPDFRVVLIAEHAGSVRAANGVSVTADFDFTSAPPLDIMMVPGGIGTRTEAVNPRFLDYLRGQHARTQVTTSVCTGSVLLAKAGILSGHRATSNKAYFSWAVDADSTVQWVGQARWVEDGKLLTSSGVSAGTDMAIGLVAKLYGLERARSLARSLEYEWHEDPNSDPFALTSIPLPSKRSP